MHEPVKAIAWSAPDGFGGEKSAVNAEVPCFCIRRDPSGLEVALDGKVRLWQFFGAVPYVTLWLKSLRPTLGPILLGLLVFTILQAMGQNSSNYSYSPFLEILVLILLINLISPQR